MCRCDPHKKPPFCTQREQDLQNGFLFSTGFPQCMLLRFSTYFLHKWQKKTNKVVKIQVFRIIHRLFHNIRKTFHPHLLKTCFLCFAQKSAKQAEKNYTLALRTFSLFFGAKCAKIRSSSRDSRELIAVKLCVLAVHGK